MLFRRKLRPDNGFDAQKAAVGRYLAFIDYELVAGFQEVETGKHNLRPQLQAAIQMAKSKKAILVIAKLDRLSRNAAFMLQLQDSGIDFICCDMPNADRLSVGIFALLVQKEREMISQRTKEGLAVIKARGVKLGTPSLSRLLKGLGKPFKLKNEPLPQKL